MSTAERKTQTKYKAANTFMLRAPLLPLCVLRDISKTSSLNELLLKFYTRQLINESIFLASPSLQRIASKYLNEGNGREENDNLNYTLLKYLIRMSSRCTPFGLFAGICSGTFGEQSNISLNPLEDHQLHIRPDMQFLCSITEMIANDMNVRQELSFRPNSSLMRIGNEYRYIEYTTDEEGLRRYCLQSVQYSKELEGILHHAACGAKMHKLALSIVDQDIRYNEAADYIHLLINNQLLISELEPSVTGDGYFDDLKGFILSKETNNPLLQMLSKFGDKISKLHFLKNNSRISMFESLVKDVKDTGIPFKENALVQADLKLSKQSCELSNDIRQDLEKIIPILMKLSHSGGNALLDKFKENFLRRYEMQEIPLALAMDAEAGPGYLPDDKNADASDLLEGLILTPKNENSWDYSWTPVDKLLYHKLQQTLMKRQFGFEITEEDLESLPEVKQNFPMSISLMARMKGKWDKADDKFLIQLENAGGSSAVNLAGRFCFLDDDLEHAMKEIAKSEQSISGDLILAEIVHLPQQRTGNILLRPVLHSYEIPYLARANVADEFSIPISDLMISVRDNRIMLRSKRLDKYILPRLSNAHNFALGSLSLYRFLCDLQSQNVRTGLGFSWGPLEQDTIFLPRVSYKNFILQPASWNIDQKGLAAVSAANDRESLHSEINELSRLYNIPREVVLTESDNELWLDLENQFCQKLFQKEIKNMRSIRLQEFIHEDDNAIVHAEDGTRTNEFVFFFHQGK